MASINLSTLNASQREVATRLEEPLFVAAGAGSGKTFTLTARLVHALSRGSASDGGRYLDSIDQALVITFTKAAAVEIAERVRGALRAAGEDDPHLREESFKVDDAWISTIHGMCSRILHRHAIELGIDPEFCMCEDSVAAALMAKALDEVLTDVRHDESFASLHAEVPLWGDSGISGLVGKIRGEAAKCPNGFDDITCPSSQETLACMQRLRLALESVCALKLTNKQEETAASALSLVEGFFSLSPSEQTPSAACAALDGVRVPALRKADQKPLADDAKRALAEAMVCAQYERVQQFARQLVEIARRVDERYAQLKLERSYLDNDDLISLALRAVEGCPEVTRDYAHKFKLVMIDEFQDTDQKQLRLIRLLAGEGGRHLTTVGDAQQSIYRFRGGDVEVFRAHGRELASEAHVRMDVNYRSDPHVLACVERVCGDTGMLPDFLKLAGDGSRKSKLVARDAGGTMPPRVLLEVAAGAASELTSATIAAQLADRLAWYREMGQPQGSMALLLGATGRMGLYLDALRARGMDAVVTGGSSFSSTPEVGVMQALLHTLANPHDTESGLFRLLSSDMFRLDANDFCLLGSRLQDKLEAPTKRPIEQCFVEGELVLYGGAAPSRRLAVAHEVLHRAFNRLGTWQLADVCMAVIDESGWLERLESAGPNGLSTAANVLAAVRYVRELTTDLGLGASRAAYEFDQWLTAAKLTPKNLSGDAVDAVRVMTVHGSKGLQFSVCAVAECWGNPKSGNGLAVGRVDGSCVLCMRPKAVSKSFSGMRKELEVPAEWRDCAMVAEKAKFLDEAEKVAEAGEKARLLYVALTRAEEALVVGLPVARQQQHKSLLALQTIGAFLDPESLAPGEQAIPLAPHAPVEVEVREQGGTQLARHAAAIDDGVLRVVRLEPGENKGDPWIADSKGTLVGFDGQLPESAYAVVALGTKRGREAPPSQQFAIFNLAGERPKQRGWRPRADVFSYSSAHALMMAQVVQDDERGTGKRPPAPPRAQQDAEAEGAAYTPDADKATSLGSAFHELAQTMVETRRDHDPVRLEALARAWHLSARQEARMREAVARWERSSLRAEVWQWPLVRAEVPFFVKTRSEFGEYVEGAIDLLASDAARGEALVVDYKTGDVGLSLEEIEERHRMQANFYAWVLMSQGYVAVTCAFCCVEVDNGAGEPVVVRYDFDDAQRPAIG